MKRAGARWLYFLFAGVLLGATGCSLIPTPVPALPPGTLLPVPTAVPGGPTCAHVLFVRAAREPAGTWRFEVTVQHADEGPDHYADRWEVLIPLPDGRTLRYSRPITQPHLQEQPFTLALSGIEIPAGATQATVRAHDSRDGYGGREITVDLNVAAGPGFQVVR